MKRKGGRLPAVLLLMGVCIVTLWSLWELTSDAAEDENSPVTLGYCQSDSYYEYDTQLYYLIKGLGEYELMPDILEGGGMDEKTPSGQLWEYAAGLDQSGWKVRFQPEVFVSLDSYYPELAEQEQSDQLDTLIQEKEVDCMITMGTKSGLTVKGLAHRPAMMNFMSADPQGAGMVHGADYSGVSGVWSQVDPDNFARSISVMYDTFRPSEVGVVYADNQDAYVYSGAVWLDQFCREKQLLVRREYVEDDIDQTGYRQYVEQMRGASVRLAPKVDVFIMTTSLLSEADYDYVLEPFYQEKVPVYSINSVADVEYGALMAVESSDYQNIGRFGADTFRKFKNGAPLEKLNQVYQTAPYLVLNYSIARKIGYQPEFSLLCSTNRIYH